jgi:hypothetical protein
MGREQDRGVAIEAQPRLPQEARVLVEEAPALPGHEVARLLRNEKRRAFIERDAHPELHQESKYLSGMRSDVAKLRPR